MEPIRVLHVFGVLDSGGAESRTMDIYRNIDRSKVQFDFLIHTDGKGFFEEEILSLGGKIYRVPRFKLNTLFTYPKAIYVFLKDHSDYKIVHGHMLSTAFIYLSIAKLRKIPVRIAHSRNSSRTEKSIIAKIKNISDRISGFNATHMFAVSKIAGESMFGKKNVKLNQVKVIPNAIQSNKFIFNQKIRQKIREELSLENDVVIGHVGRMSIQKNHLFLLEVFKEVKKKLPNAKLILIGDGPNKLKIIDKIAKLGLEENVLLLGVRDDVNNLYQAMDVFLFPSTHEGLPGVVLEAQASGLPCVISKAITYEVNITDLVEYVSLKRDEKNWAEIILGLVNSVERKNMHEEITQAGFDINTVAQKYEAFYLNNYSDYKS